jgi:hypothetical protein
MYADADANEIEIEESEYKNERVSKWINVRRGEMRGEVRGEEESEE